MKQYKLTLHGQGRGYWLITDQIEQAISAELSQIEVGLLHVFIQHSSASITVNESADPRVREDFKNFEEHLVPRNFPYKHNDEGDDDMPAHIKASLLGCELSLPISKGRLALGTWQAVYLCEHRDRPQSRNLILTLHS